MNHHDVDDGPQRIQRPRFDALERNLIALIITFETFIADRREAAEETDAIMPGLPFHVFKVAIGGLYNAGLVAAFAPVSRGLPLLKQVFNLNKRLFGSLTIQRWVFGSTFLLHIVETYNTARLCKRKQLTQQQTLMYCIGSMLWGALAIVEVSKLPEPKAE